MASRSMHFSSLFNSASQQWEAGEFVKQETGVGAKRVKETDLRKQALLNNFESDFARSFKKEAKHEGPSPLALMKEPASFEMAKAKLFRRGLVLEAQFTENDNQFRVVLRARPFTDFLPQNLHKPAGAPAMKVGKQLARLEQQAEILFHDMNKNFRHLVANKQANKEVKEDYHVLAEMLGARPHSFRSQMEVNPEVVAFAVEAAENQHATLVFVPLRETPLVMPLVPFAVDTKAEAPRSGSQRRIVHIPPPAEANKGDKKIR